MVKLTAAQARHLTSLATTGKPAFDSSDYRPLEKLRDLGLITLPVTVFGQGTTGELAITAKGREYADAKGLSLDLTASA